jgi:hypothetical protein
MVFGFLRKFAEIFASQGAPMVSTTSNFATGINDSMVNFATGTAKLPPISATPAANLPLVLLIIRAILACHHLKVNLKEKIYLLCYPKVTKQNN